MSQILGILITIVFVGVCDVILGFIVKACFKGSLRVSEEAEAQGLEVAEPGESAYPAYIGLDYLTRSRKELNNMKRIVAIVRPEKLEPLKEALFAEKVGGMTISQVNGCGSQHGWKEYYRGTEVLLNMVPKVRFELVVADDEVDGLVKVITETARTGNVGDGKIFVSPVDEVIRIRTDERGEAAV